MADLITDKERADHFKTTLSYIYDNLKHRDDPDKSCATDEKLIKWIEYNLSDKGMKEAIEYDRNIDLLWKSGCF